MTAPTHQDERPSGFAGEGDDVPPRRMRGGSLFLMLLLPATLCVPFVMAVVLWAAFALEPGHDLNWRRPAGPDLGQMAQRLPSRAPDSISVAAPAPAGTMPAAPERQPESTETMPALTALPPSVLPVTRPDPEPMAEAIHPSDMDRFPPQLPAMAPEAGMLALDDGTPQAGLPPDLASIRAATAPDLEGDAATALPLVRVGTAAPPRGATPQRAPSVPMPQRVAAIPPRPSASARCRTIIVRLQMEEGPRRADLDLLRQGCEPSASSP